jgi:hypothetical protein
MASYTRQSSFADGDTITAALFNNEFNQLVNAFHNSTGHKHDGTTAEGPVIGLIGDAGETSPNNKVLIDTVNNYIEFYVEVSSAPVQQLYIADGAIIPVTDSDVDLGTTSLRFKDTYTDTVTTTGNVDIGGNLTVTGNATISGNLTFGDADTDSINLAAEIDSDIIPNTDGTYDLGSATKEWQDLYIDGTANIDSLVADTADINGGTIDGATIATSDITVGSGKTLDVSSGTITLADDQISGDKVEGGTIAATTITSLTATSADINGGTIDGTTIATSDITVGASKTLDVSAGTLTLADNQISGDKVEGGTIAATNITDLTFGSLNDGTITVTAFVDEDDMTSDSATLIPTQQSVKAYVDSQVTAQDLDFQGDTGGALSIDLDSETLTIAGGTGLDTVGSGNTVTVAIDSTVATLTGTQTLTNKTIDVDNNTVSNIEVDNLKSGVLDTDLTSVAATDTTLASAKAIKTYVDAQITAEDLDLTTDSGTIAVDLDSETLSILGGTGLDSSATGNAVTIAIDSTVATLTGTQTLTNKTIDAASNTLSNIANSSLTNSTVSYGGVSLALGASDATPAFDLTDATNYPTSSLTGTITNAQLAGSIEVSKTLLAAGTGLTLSTDTLSVDAAQTQITSVGTLGSLTVSGDLTIDTNTLVVDSTNNRVGILDATPAVSLDAGSATDAIFVPKGTTAQRPTGVDGYFRYNTDDAQFEGYADGAWGAIAGSGGGGSAIEPQIFAGDGSTVDFTLTSAPTSENNLLVFIDGVFQAHDSYSVSGTTLTFSTAPANTRVVTVYHARSSISGSNMIVDTMTGDNSDVTLTLSVAPVSENNVQVYFDGVYQSKANYSISGTTLTFSTAPATGVAVEAISFTQTSVNAPTNDSVATATIQDGAVTADKLASGVGGVAGIVSSADATAITIDSSENVGIGVSPSYKLHISGTSGSNIIRVQDTGNNAGIGIGAHATNGAEINYGGVDTLRFVNVSAERMRIDSSGNLLLGTTSHSTGAFGAATGINIKKPRPQVLLQDTTNNTDGYFGLSTGALFLATQDNINIQFYTNDVERMRIDSAGNLLVGTTSTLGASAAGTTHITGGSNSTDETPLYLRNPNSTAGRYWKTGPTNNAGYIVYNNANTGVYITYGNNSWTSGSDESLKENISDVGSVIDKVKDYRCVNYSLKSQNADTADRVGFIAQDWENDFPNVVDKNDEGILGMKYTETIPVLLKAIQEQQALIETQATTITDLTTRIETLENA